MRLRSIAVFVSVAAVSISQASIVAASRNGTDHTITICHRTKSMSNPYVQITVDKASADGTGGRGDHYLNHTGGVWTPDSAKGDWGDIIPPIEGVHAGRNWTEEGQAIWENGCKPQSVDALNVGIDEEGDTDEDEDGVPDVVDIDDDNDKTPDAADSDDDNDGVTDSQDPDDDNDGIPDTQDGDTPPVEVFVEKVKPEQTPDGWEATTKVRTDAPEGAGKVRVGARITCVRAGRPAPRACDATIVGKTIRLRATCISGAAKFTVTARATNARNTRVTQIVRVPSNSSAAGEVRGCRS